MRIVHVSSSYKPSWETGGTVRVVYEISRKLSGMGHEVRVVTTDVGAKRVRARNGFPTSVDGAEVYSFRNLSNILAMRRIVTPYKLPFLCKRIVADADIVHIHEHRTLNALAIQWASRKLGIPYVVQSHGSLTPKYGKGRLKDVFDKICGRDMLVHASAVLALNSTEAALLLSMGVHANRIHILPNGIDPLTYANMPKRGAFRKVYSISGDTRIVLYVGRLHSSKRLDLLIDAFSQIAFRCNVLLVIAGRDDGYKGMLLKRIAENGIGSKVVLTDYLSEDMKMAVMTDSDVFVTPSFTGFPLTFLEACMFGLPIVTTNDGDFLDWIEGEVGRVVDPNATSLAGAIEEILTDEQMAKEMSTGGMRMVNCRFAWDAVVKNLCSIYLNCIDRSVM